MKTKNLFLATVLVAFGAVNENIAQVNNVTLGYGTGASLTTGGSNNVFIGVNSGTHTTTGLGNVFVGCESGRESLTGNYNTFIGNQSSLGNSSGVGNTSIGSSSGYNNTSGQYNTNIGTASGLSISSGIRNICVGTQSGEGLTTGYYNTFLGRVNVGGNSNISNSIILADGDSNQRFYIHSNGYAGIGLGDNIIPQNRLEIKHGVAGNSGLRLTNLPNTASSIANPTNKVLSVNNSGDVILVDDKQGTGSGTATTNILSSNTNTMTSIVNDIVANAPIINTVVNTIASGELTTTINGVSSAPITLPTSGSGTDTSIYANDGTLASNRVVTMGNNDLIFNTTGNTTATGGRVYIGNTTAFTATNFPTNTGDYRLYVEGGVLTEKVKVALRSTANWADYVFAKDYKLMPLNEVEAYVKTNKHLPGISSADKLVAEGLDVAEMQAKQMEKIEELTLYAIEQNKKIEKQEKEIEELKVLVKTLINKNK